MRRLAVIGIGSPFGDDTLGWQALDALQASGWQPPGWHLRLVRADRPGSRLLELFEGMDAVVLLDAVLPDAELPDARAAAGAPAAVRRMDLGELQRHDSRTSSHGLGVAEVLALGERLGMLPPQLWIIGLLPGALDRDALLAELQALPLAGRP